MLVVPHQVDTHLVGHFASPRGGRRRLVSHGRRCPALAGGARTGMVERGWVGDSGAMTHHPTREENAMDGAYTITQIRENDAHVVAGR